MKQNKDILRKNNLLLFILVSFCAIILFMVKTIADDNLNMRQVRYQLGSMVNYEFSFYTDSPKFHTKASGYEKYKGMNTENNMNSIIATDMVKMQGYGNYEFKPDTNLFSFIDYCYSKDPATTMACAYRAGTTAENEWNYTKLMNYRDRAINTDFFKHFWQNMSSLCTNFKDYQDDFFFLHYTYPATQKVGINLAMMRNLQNEGESVKEYLTCLTSYIFSITPQAQVNGMTFGKGDVVPFLYYKDRKHADLDVRNDSEALMDIAKYAYVALIEGWCTLPTPYHLWENEYNWLFGNYEPENLDYDLETLHQWYDETYQRYCRDKGRKGNNLLGSTIEHIIESDYSIETQLEATEYYIRGIFNDLGIETDFKETMARNELMAKYMMQNSNFDATIKDYNVTIEFMTENLQRGTHEEQNTHTVVTSDFQKLEFPYTSNQRFLNHSDEDGISDGAELGNEKWINITEFVKKTYEEAVRNGDPHKATFEAQVEDIIEKNGAYTDFGGNKVYGSVKWDDKKLKVLYRVYDYKSNPKLNDTDFDGLWDNADTKPIDNKLSGTSTEIGKVEYNQDFRWFYTDNKKYNDELCTMSLIASNLARGNTITTDQVSGNIQEYLEKLGFTDIRNISNNGEVYVGKKKITYYGITKNIYALIIGERNLENNYRAMLMKAQENNGTTNAVYIDFGKTLEEKATEIGRLAFLDNNFGTDTYWVTGYGLGGSIASELASKLTDAGGEVFCYTFGAINTGTNRKGTYANIKNVINEDDYIPKMMNKNIYSKPGQIYSNSIKENLMFEYRDITGNTDYRGDYCLSNFLTHIFEVKKNGMTIDKYRQLVEEMARNLTYFTSLSREVQIDGEISDLAIAYDNMTKANKDAHSIKSYYVLAKSLNGFDLLDEDEKKQEHYKRKDEAMVVAFSRTEEDYIDENEYGNIELLDIIDATAEFYINNIPTYQSSLKTTSNYFYETRPARDNIKPYLATKSMTEVQVSKRGASDFYKEMDEEVSDKKMIVYYSTGLNKFKNSLGFEKKIVERFTTSKVPRVNVNEFETSNEKIFKYNGLYWYKWRDYFVTKESPYISAHQKGTGFDIGINIAENDITENAKDDCSGFAKLVLDIYLKSKNYAYTALPINLTSQSLLGTNNSSARKLMDEGFEVYKCSISDNNWKRYKNGVEQEKKHIIRTKDLESGDLLVCDNCGTKTEYSIKNDKSYYEITHKNNNPLHAEFYVGYEYRLEYQNETFESMPGFTYQDYDKNNVNRKSGIQSLIRGNIIDIVGNKAEGTFSWGNIADEYPLESSSGQKHYFYKRDNEAFFRHCECGEEPEAIVRICSTKTYKIDKKTNTIVEQKLVDALTPIEIADRLKQGVVLTYETKFFPSHMLSTKKCYFNERKYDTLWRFMK